MVWNQKMSLIVGGLVSCAALVGCNQLNTRPDANLAPVRGVDQSDPRATLILASAKLIDNVRLGSSRFQPVGQLTRAQVTVQNLSDNRYTLEYQFEWEDVGGISVGNSGSWHRFTLSPRGVKKFTSTGKVPEAVNITFTTRLPDDVFIQRNKAEEDKY